MNQYQSDTLAGGVPTVVNIATVLPPVAVFLDSSAGGRKIAVSQTGAANTWADVTPTYTSTNEISYELEAQMGYVRFTGADGDTWGVR